MCCIRNTKTGNKVQQDSGKYLGPTVASTSKIWDMKLLQRCGLVGRDTAWFGRCAPQLRRNVFLSWCCEDTGGTILTKQTSTLSRDCIVWQHRNFVLRVAFCSKMPSGEDKNSEWENKQLNLRYSLLTLMSLWATQITQQRIFRCRQPRNMSGGAEENNEKRHAKWSVPDTIFEFQIPLPRRRQALVIWVDVVRTKPERRFTFLTLTEEWQCVQHNAADSWPKKWSKKRIAFECSLWQQKKNVLFRNM